QKGWFVGAYDVNANGLATLAQEIGADNGTTGILDVTKKADFEAAVAAFGAETGGTMDILFNNAGIGESGFFEDVPYEQALRVVQVNLVGVLTGIYTALPLLKATRNSLCFTTSSSSATYGMPRLAVYSATKHAVKGLTEALSIEFAPHAARAPHPPPRPHARRAAWAPQAAARAHAREGPAGGRGRGQPRRGAGGGGGAAGGAERVRWSRVPGFRQREAPLGRAAPDRLDRPHQGLVAR